MDKSDNTKHSNITNKTNLSNQQPRKLNKKLLFWWIFILILFALVLLYYNFSGSRLIDWQEILPIIKEESVDIVTYQF